MSKGKKAPTYNLCKISIPGTNLFCGATKGIPRAKMPQLAGVPRPGSDADKLPKNQRGRINGGEEFTKHLVSKGVKVTDKVVNASSLKASQNELSGKTVARMMKDPKFDPTTKSIFVSRDGYVIDGHHRWAAQITRDMMDGKTGDLKMKVQVVDMDIKDVLDEANRWSNSFGIKREIHDA